MNKSNKRLLALILIVISIDVVGYIIIESANFLDALFMSIISITTVGYSETFPLSTLGKIFTIYVILSGLGVFLYGTSRVAEFLVEGRLRAIFGRRRRMNNLLKMQNHVIVCGFGRMGQRVCELLKENNKAILIIDRDAQVCDLAEQNNFIALQEDATKDDVLLNVNLGKAKSFISLLSTDADNIFTVMSARDLNKNLRIISRVFDSNNEKKLQRVGANRVINPYNLSSKTIANIVSKPNVINLIDVVTKRGDVALTLEEITLIKGSALNGKSLRDSGLRDKFNIIVVAVNRGGKMHFNPGADFTFIEGDILVLIGDRDKISGI